MIQTTGILRCVVCGAILGQAPSYHELEAFREGQKQGALGMQLSRNVDGQWLEVVVTPTGNYCKPDFEEAVMMSMQLAALGGRRPYEAQ